MAKKIKGTVKEWKKWEKWKERENFPCFRTLEEFEVEDIPFTYFGELYTSYANLKRIFGMPTQKYKQRGYKSDVEWVILFDDGMFNIYNWKNGKNYLGSSGRNITNIKEWHIGICDRMTPKADVTRFLKDVGLRW